VTVGQPGSDCWTPLYSEYREHRDAGSTAWVPQDIKCIQISNSCPDTALTPCVKLQHRTATSLTTHTCFVLLSSNCTQLHVGTAEINLVHGLWCWGHRILDQVCILVQTHTNYSQITTPVWFFSYYLYNSAARGVNAGSTDFTIFKAEGMIWSVAFSFLTCKPVLRVLLHDPKVFAISSCGPSPMPWRWLFSLALKVHQLLTVLIRDNPAMTNMFFQN
jgi:hypothetical protein